jgi:hypothetical protein
MMLGYPRDIWVDGVRIGNKNDSESFLRVTKGERKRFNAFLDNGGGLWHGKDVVDKALPEPPDWQKRHKAHSGLAGILATDIDMDNVIDDERLSKPHALLSRVCHHSLGVRR